MSIRPARQSVRPSPVFLAIVAITAVGGVLAWLSAADREPMAYVGVFTFVIAGWIVSLSLHEFGHAFTAWRFGDNDVAVRGYLTLNPLKYSNPLLSILLPVLIIVIGGIGLPGGAVWVRTSFMTNRQKTLVSLAGPFTNVVFAVLLLALTSLLRAPGAFGVLGRDGVSGLPPGDRDCVLNLLPVPGLDGYGALEPHLSPQTQRALAARQTVGLVRPAAPVLHAAAQPVVLLGRAAGSSISPACPAGWSATASI